MHYAKSESAGAGQGRAAKQAEEKVGRGQGVMTQVGAVSEFLAENTSALTEKIMLEQSFADGKI